MTSSDKFGQEHFNFRFHFATKTSQEQEKLTEQQGKREEILLLSGFDKSMTKGWKVKPLLFPPVVSKHFTVSHICMYMTYESTLYKQVNMYFNSSNFDRLVRELLMTLINQGVLVFLITMY